jgi:hypothetical protein
MSSKNRILKYIQSSPPKAECVVISDVCGYRVILSYDGTKLLWKWDNGLVCPGSRVPIAIHALAAEALVTEEMMAFFRMEGVDTDKVIYVTPSGEKTDGIIISPRELGTIDFDVILKKIKIKELYEKFIDEDDNLSEDIIGEAIRFGVLSPFLSLVNLNS